MSDSQIIVFGKESVQPKNEKNNKPFFDQHDTWSKFGIICENGEPTGINSLSSYATGLTKAKNHVKAVLDDKGVNPFKVTGYHASVNPPASLVGNNALIENLVYLGAVADKYIVQKMLLKTGVSVDAVKRISVDNSKFLSVTLTYLLMCTSHEEAIEKLNELKSHASMLF